MSSIRSARGRERAASEPSPQVVSGNFTRERARKTDLDFERGKDKLAHWIGAWKYDEVCSLLQNLIARCPINQMEYLWTVMESVPHRDFLYSVASPIHHDDRRPASVLEKGHFRPLSTPASRSVTARLRKSRYVENQHLYRAESITLNDGFQSPTTALNDLYLFESPIAQSESQLLRPFSEASKNPGISSHKLSSPARHSPAHTHLQEPAGRISSTPKPRLVPSSSWDKPVPTRILTPMRRHMSPSKQASHQRPSTCGRETRNTNSRPNTGYGARNSASRPDTGFGMRFTARRGTESRPVTGNGPRLVIGRLQVTIAGLEANPDTTSATEIDITQQRCNTITSGITTTSSRLDTRSSTYPGRLKHEPRPTSALHFMSEMNQTVPLPQEVVEFLKWFNNVQADWKQQELLQIVICNLDNKELYFLSALVLSRQYRDFVSQLPEPIAVKILGYIPGKTILLYCSRVSRGWNYLCNSEALWKEKIHHQVEMGLPVSYMKKIHSWKKTYLEDLKLKKNWTKGRYVEKQMNGHTKKVVSVHLKDDLVVSGSADHTIRVWSLSTMECISVLQGHTDTVWCVRFYGKTLVISASGDGLIKIWNYRTGACEKTLSYHSGSVWSLQQKRDLLVSGGQDKLVCVWNLRHCCLSKEMRGHNGVVFTVEMNDSTDRTYSGSRDNAIREWHTESGMCLRVMNVSAFDAVLDLHWDKDFLVGCYGRRITIWNTETWEVFASFIAHDDRVDSVKLWMSGHHAVPTGLLLSGSQDKSVKYWNVNSLRHKALSGVEDKVHSADFNAIYVVCGSHGAVIQVWDFQPHSRRKHQRMKEQQEKYLAVGLVINDYGELVNSK